MGADLYERREQTFVKHEALRAYLERFAHIVGYSFGTLVYVDGFAGPWKVRSETLDDSSFAIAIRELRRAREDLAQIGKTVRLRCFFVEEDPDAYAQLRKFCDGCSDVEIETRLGSFEAAIPRVQEFVRDSGPGAFTFVFIDPTGWSGFGMKAIAPLVRHEPGEVLVNFMTGYINRFLTSDVDQIRAGMVDLFGSEAFADRVKDLSGVDREDAMVDGYAANLRTFGRFSFSCTAAVLNPKKDRSHFHLVYATRNLKGVREFKRAEKGAMKAMEDGRASVERTKKKERTGMSLLPFESDEAPPSAHYAMLRKRYLLKGKNATLAELERAGAPVPFDDVVAIALRYPLVWETDVTGWVSEWEKVGTLEVRGKGPRQRVAKSGNLLCLKP